MKTALVTGDLGFVGRHVAAVLRDRDWLVMGIDIKRGAYALQDARDFFRYGTDRFDLVVHCAAVVGGRLKIEGEPLELAVDLAIDAELWGWALRTRPGRIVYYSSSAAYPVSLQNRGIGPRLSERFISFDFIDPPDMTYGWAKLTGEMLAGQARDAGVPVTVLRPFSGYGEDQDLDYPFPAFIDRAARRAEPFEVWGDGRQVRDWIHIDDIVEATLTCVENGVDGPLNLGWGRPTSFLRLAELVTSAAGYSPEILIRPDRPSGVGYRVCDPARMLEVYQPTIALEEGIARALAARVST